MAITFAKDMPAYRVGRRVNMEEWNAITRTKEGAGTLGFAVPATSGFGDHTCTAVTASGQNVLGITAASLTLPHAGDAYEQYDNVAIYDSAVVGVLLGGAVTKGQPARFNVTTQSWTSAAASATNLTIPGAQFEADGASGEVGAVRYRRPIPSLSASS